MDGICQGPLWSHIEVTMSRFKDWSPEKAAALYRVRDWSAGYFGLSDDGLVTVTLDFPQGRVAVPLMDMVRGMGERGLQMPVLLRIENLLDAQIARLNESFRAAIQSLGYLGEYRGVFPIKVNQQRQVIEEIAAFGARYGHGLEAGSKAELIVALAMLEPGQGMIVCNGYKDEEFADLGLLARKIGYNCIFVIESPAELPVILERSDALGVRPGIGARVKLSSRVGGLWNETSGDRSIFGLTTTQLVELVDSLRTRGMLDCLMLLHYHLGSQIPNIRDIRRGVLEACRYYVDLVHEGADLGYLDLGGGLAVDYDGSSSNHPQSKNYSLDEYTVDVVEAVMGVLDPAGVPHPTIVTESGRATVAYASVLLFNALDVTNFEPAGEPASVDEGQHELLHQLAEVQDAICTRGPQECYNDAIYYLDETRDLFRRGQIGMRSQALAEDLFLRIMHRIARQLDAGAPAGAPIPPELSQLPEKIADVYYGNFSVFQSLPDSWAIGQLFPIMAIHRHREAPIRQAIIADITCDSDGKIDRFIGLQQERRTLPVHALEEGEEYYLGVFLVGAYQETLGDLHNLLGDTNVVSVRINPDGSFDFVKEMQGDTIADVLSYVEYDPRRLKERFRDTAEQAVRSGRITPAERARILDQFAASLRGYTYFEK
jgi:arginine decarboxylase